MKMSLAQNKHSRTGFAFLLSLAGHIFVFGVFMLIRVCSFDTLGTVTGPMLVRIGTEKTQDDIIKAAQSETETTREAQSVQSAVQTNQESGKPKAVPGVGTGALSPEQRVQQAASQTTQAKPVEQAKLAETAKSAEPQLVSIKGSESGNSYELQYLGALGEVRRSLYVPIFLFMPVPYVLPKELVEGIRDKIIDGKVFTTAEEFKKILFKYYEFKEGNYQLKELQQPELADRPEIWSILEENGYDLHNAEYKVGKNLRSVQIRFTVLPPQGTEGGKLINVKLIKSSGYSDIDKAVEYGFMQGRFSNSSNREIDAVFTYWF